MPRIRIRVFADLDPLGKPLMDRPPSIKFELSYIPSTNFFGSDIAASVVDGALTVSKEVNLSVIAENDSGFPRDRLFREELHRDTLSASDADGDAISS